jgi:inosine-uridine nucleoside N-ribohydrolase
LIAVTVTKDHELAAPFVDCINTFYGRGNIPIGVCKSGVTPEAGKFNILANDAQKYPHDLKSGKDAQAAVEVLRQALANAEDGSVVIAQVGFSSNLANLLKSEPDSYSKLDGLELVRQKVRLLSVMAGAFTEIAGDDGKPKVFHEYNVVMDIPAAKYLFTHWPTPTVWSGFEIGIALPYPHQSILNDYAYAENHPLPEAYKLYMPPPHDRPTWDLTSVLYAIRPDHGYFDLSSVGDVAVSDDGVTTFTASENGKNRFLKLGDHQKARVTEALVLLASEPPTAK